MLQRYFELGAIDVISVSGYIARYGSVLAFAHSRKVTQSPRRLGVGTMFEPLTHQPYTDGERGRGQDSAGYGHLRAGGPRRPATHEY